MGNEDPRLELIRERFKLHVAPEELLIDLDLLSPNETIRRLQHELWVAWGNDAIEWNLWRATEIVEQIDRLMQLQNELKPTFARDALEGGWRAALEHPLYLSAARSLESLREELKGLI